MNVSLLYAFFIGYIVTYLNVAIFYNAVQSQDLYV